MASLLNRVCTLCDTETWSEDGFVMCNCKQVNDYDWAMGVLETPKEWNDSVGVLMDYRRRHYEGMIDRQAANEVELKKYIWELEQENKQYTETIFELRGENYALRERVANLEKMITRSA